MPANRHSDTRPPLPGNGILPDYSLPFFVTSGVLCFFALVALWAAYGMPLVLIAATAADWLLRRA
ncbi:hypothetical protein [Pseudoruegeria sp. HB172150]|uniref:hypothetical protein n=1 Tax=Pseudoruegeria sp. HB172150 TaxID=2721164 RepID=UPI001555DC10|nr:hypothetical protein [Pseudoruegeria sp. HB172150]